MAFTDPDPIEQQMGLRCEDMTPDELVAYIRTYQNAFDRRMAVEGTVERKVFEGMKRIYGEKTAGQIVKWAFYKYKGIWKGDVVVFTSFSKGRKWWVDMMYQELQAALRKETTSASRVGIGSKRLSDL